ncbi:hypothetical protein Tco_0652236 [Tanacetum coccineum]|uniref:Uncharacterized protein n=1 Tax=Tanacetum coccineum TaxID=301880 RepID=A0ABQ4WX05_9ASTR
MCHCHLLLESDPSKNEVVLRRQALMQKSHILTADEQRGSSRHRSSPKDEDMIDRDRHKSSRGTRGREEKNDKGRDKDRERERDRDRGQTRRGKREHRRESEK